MAARKTKQPLRSGGFAWGRERVSAGISLKELEERTGINAGFLSRMENGRMVPTAEEFDRVMAVLRAGPA